MATFHRQKKALKKTRARRTFSGAKSKKTAKKASPKIVDSHKSPPNAAPKTLQKENPSKKAKEKSPELDSTDEITRFINTASKNLQSRHQSNIETAQTNQVTTFDGLSSEQERFEFLQQQLQEEQRKAHKLEHQLALVKAEFDTEKEALEKQMKELKKELHRTTPIADNKFFSLSKELRGAVSAIEEVANTGGSSISEQPQLATPPTPETLPALMEDAPTQAPTPKAITKPTAKETKIDATSKPNDDSSNSDAPTDEKVTQSPTKKKKVIAAGGAIILLLAISTGASVGIFSRPKVDQELVDQYLESQAQETGIVAGSSDNSYPTEPGQPPQNITDDDRIFKDVAFEDTLWESFKDPIFGIQFQYPSNATKVAKTDSSATFSRKEGYIFKVQRIETGLELEEYWKQIQGTSLDYTVTELQFGNHDALFLELNEESPIPGNKYLVKAEDVIYDIWFTTDNEKFSSDDVKRAQQMLDSISFISL